MNKLIAAMLASLVLGGTAFARDNTIVDNVTGNRQFNNLYTSTPAGAANASRNLATMQRTSAYAPAQATYNNQMNYLRSPSMEKQVSAGYRMFGGGAVRTR